VWLVELAPVTDAVDIAPTVLGSLGLRESQVLERRPERRARDAMERLLDALFDASCLLVIDNCEHLVDACAELVLHLLAEAPALRILATSREPLEIDGETTFVVRPLVVPHDLQELSVRDYKRSSAMQLFAERVVARNPEFRVTSENVHRIASICNRLGGVPLALELAAGRLGSLTLDDLEGQIEEQLGFQSLRRDVPARHHTMRSAITWTYDALEPAEQELWRRFCIFPGGASLSTLESVCADDPLPESTLQHALQGLVEKSVVTLESRQASGRYRMLEPLRLFGLERVREDGSEPELRRKQLEWCAGLIPAGAWIDGAGQLGWMRVFEAEYANLAASFDYSLQHGWELDDSLRLFSETFLFWGLRGWYRDQGHFARRFLDAVPGASPARTTVLFAAGFNAWYTYANVDARAWFEECLEHAAGDERLRGLALYGLGLCELAAENYAGADAVLERACADLEASESWVFLANARHQLVQGRVLNGGSHESANAVIERNLELGARGDHWNGGMTHSTLGILAWRTGELDRARAHLVEAIELQSELGHLFGLASSLDGLAWVSVSRRAFSRGATLIGAADRIYRRLGTGLLPGLIPDRERAAARARQALGHDRYRARFAAGWRLGLVEAVAYALERDAALDDDTAGKLSVLTPRERQIAELLSQGATNGQIGFELMIGIETVKTHIRTILRKLGFESRVQIAGWYSSFDSDELS
jgi:non-specific serine/threonine protein kinase